MGNLGGYQLMTTAAKAVGGPRRLGTIVLVGGYALIRTAEAGVKRAPELGKRVSTEISRRRAPHAHRGTVFTVTAEGSNGEVELKAGQEFRVVEGDGDAVLIEVIDASGNPYCVSTEFLSSISGYPEHGRSGEDDDDRKGTP